MAGDYMAEAFDFDLFDTSKKTAGSAAPEIKKPAKPKLVKAKPRTGRELKKEERNATLKALKVLSVSIVILVLLGSILFGRVKIMEAENKARVLQTQIEEAQSENVRLNNEVKSMCSITNISAYAEEKLGMIKKDCYQVNYFSVDGSTPAN